MSATHYTPRELLLRIDPIVANREDEGRQAFRKVLEGIGCDEFGALAIAYLRSYLPIGNSVLGIFDTSTAFTESGLLYNDTDNARLCLLYLTYLKDVHEGTKPANDVERPQDTDPVFQVTTPLDTGDFISGFRDMLDLKNDLRLFLELDANRMGVIILSKPEWKPQEVEFAIRCAGFLRSAFQAHDRTAQKTMTEKAEKTFSHDDVNALIGEGILSERENEIAAMMLRGSTTEAIAEHIKISAATVKVHRRNIYSKLNISSQAELFAMVFRELSA